MSEKKQLGIGLLGFGTVGTGVWKILAQHEKLLEERTGSAITIRKICVRDVKKKREVALPAGLLTSRPEDLLEDPSIGVVVEVMGGIDPAGRLIVEALKRGKHVVTANKALLSQRGSEIFKAAREAGVSVGFEASVAGGIPILKAIREGFVANQIREIYGIINGTANFILTEMTDRGGEFAAVLKEAQKAGYAEQDPAFDVKGIDAAQKLAILISLCYGVEPPKEGIFVEGIEKITPMDIEFARKLGYTIKLLAVSKDHAGSVEARVHPTMIPSHHPLADVKGVFNAVFLKGDAVGEAMFFGRGAGMMPTASAVMSDVAMVARGLAQASSDLTSLKPPTLQSIDDLASEYYLRFSALDKPGVLSQIAKYLGDHDISIASVYQRERDAGSRVPIVIMTHEARESSLRKAIQEIDGLEAVVDETVVIRVERFSKD